jgi:hypothetical protein
VGGIILAQEYFMKKGYGDNKYPTELHKQGDSVHILFFLSQKMIMELKRIL